MRLNPKALFAITLCMTLAWMFVAPSDVCAQKGGGKSQGGNKSQGGSRGQSGGNANRGSSGVKMQGGGAPGRGMSSGGSHAGSPGNNSRGSSVQRSPSAIINGSNHSGSGVSRSPGINLGSNQGFTSDGRNRSNYSGSGTTLGSINQSRGGSSYQSGSGYGGNHNQHGGDRHQYGGDRHQNGGNFYGGNYYGGYSGFRPSYNQFYIGPSGLGYSYYGSGFGLSIGLPLNRYYDNYAYYDNYNYNVARPYYDVAQPYYNVAQPYYVESYPSTSYPAGGSYLPPVYSEYGTPAGLPTLSPAQVVETSLETPTPAGTNTGASASVITAAGNASQYQLQAEQAFRNNQYQDAARLSTHAIIEDGENGKLHLFAAQVFFALGDYRSSAAAIQRAASLLDKSEWGFVVENFKQFYRGTDYVNQMDALVKFTKANPDLSYVHFLRGYHYKYLGYDEAARAPLTRAIELESRDRLAAELLVMAGGTLPAKVTPVNSIPIEAPQPSLQSPANEEAANPLQADLAQEPAAGNNSTPAEAKSKGAALEQPGEIDPAETKSIQPLPVEKNELPKIESSKTAPTSADDGN